ncbi:hypothetical protein PORCAN_171 [Porphyromonas crevioricanis JCM 13913]|nr:hypothetical protein PORCAN_171 [Porphyromonas crevioricanis JCM 13913]
MAFCRDGLLLFLLKLFRRGLFPEKLGVVGRLRHCWQAF